MELKAVQELHVQFTAQSCWPKLVVVTRETDVKSSPRVKTSLLHIHQRWIRYCKWTQVCSQVQLYKIHALHTLGAFTRPEENEEGVCALLSG